MKLAGNDIPLGARIFAVADAFDALTNDRPYRKGTSIEQARDEIRRHSGSHFDPKVVDAFCSVTVEQLERIACALGDSISHFHK
jgi:HD-GYP domain-containing protein (c-di-GMP phosphodiesterase class II)